ncbi:MAG: isoamylase early set domain-containing protein [Phycisphaeraceae bacterium]
MIQVQGDIVQFRFRCPVVQSVYLAGDFNDWSVSATPMARIALDLWYAEMKLPPGDYRFRYFTSHRGWMTDWAAFGVERNPFGDWNSIIHVPPRFRVLTSHPSTTDAQVEPAPEQPHLLLRSVANQHPAMVPVPALQVDAKVTTKRIRKSPARH